MLGNTIGELFDKAIHHHRKKQAVKDVNRTITYEQLGEEVNQFANALLKLGIQPKDRIALWMENSIEYIVADFAIAKIGAVRVPLNTFLNNQEVIYRLNDSEARMIVCDQKLTQRVEEVIKETAIQPMIISTGEGSQLQFRPLVNQSSKISPDINVTPSDLAAIMYTGGTTGRSKGVMHTHETIIAIFYSEIVEFELEPGVVMLHLAPLPHAAGFLLLPGLLRGGKQILQQRFDPKTFCQTIEQERVTFTFLVPTMIYILIDYPGIDHYDFSSLKTMIYGAAPMAPNRIKQAINLFGPVLTQVYSQMEVANQTTILSKEDHLSALERNEDVLQSCGKSIIMSHLKIINEQGEESPPHTVGEIVTKGPHMMKGYWKMEGETEKTIRNGWLHTGDMAYQDEEGYLYLVDRKKDMIITGGFNVYTTVVEKALFEHPEVRQAAVIGIPDEKWGEAVRAFVVANQDTITEEELLHYCKIKLAKYEVPKSIEFLNKLPITAYGKIDKNKLRKPFWSSLTRQVN